MLFKWMFSDLIVEKNHSRFIWDMFVFFFFFNFATKSFRWTKRNLLLPVFFEHLDVYVRLTKFQRKTSGEKWKEIWIILKKNHKAAIICDSTTEHYLDKGFLFEWNEHNGLFSFPTNSPLNWAFFCARIKVGLLACLNQ